jgi:hypothetical protein
MGSKPRSVAVGDRFGRLTILELTNTRSPSGASRTTVVCRCDCGLVKSYEQGNVTSGHTRSCGCLAKEIIAASRPGVKHDMHKSSEYGSWQAMKERCYRETHVAYHRYGGRGITVCDRWLNSFEAFYEDMGPKPFPRASIERKGNNGNYEPGNCCWATARQQGRNRCDNVLVPYQGELLPIAEAAERAGLKPSCLKERIRRGWAGDKLFIPPLQ